MYTLGLGMPLEKYKDDQNAKVPKIEEEKNSEEKKNHQ